MELNQVTSFYKYITEITNSEKETMNLRGILGYSRSEIFINGTEPHWDANVWYLERFDFQRHRKDESRMTRTLSFLDIRQRENRELFQMYMRYELGISNQSLSVVRAKFFCIRKYLSIVDREGLSVKNLPAERTRIYLEELSKQELEASTFNIMLAHIAHFYYFLRAHQYISAVPFDPDYYMKKQVAIHHNRSVAFEICQEILRKLNCFPEHLRIMYLHLWAVGLRISEVCVLKSDSYFRRGENAWIRIYQVKMKAYKSIPIPDMLYQFVQVYIIRNAIGKGEYLFRDSQGNAFKYGTFVKQMKNCCKANGIENGNYIFKAHDYRHTVATMFYENGVSIQSIRDYLGHETEEMTEQYIDHIPQMIAWKNEEFFEKKENILWTRGRIDGKREHEDILQ